MKVYKIDITPLATFKELPSSYTIFGAVCWGYLLLYGEQKLNELLSKFAEGNTPFLLSSFLPRIKGSYYFPKPKLKSIREKNKNLDYKKIKKIEYIDLETLEKVLKGQINTETSLYEVLISKDIPETAIYEKNSIPHASIDRLSTTTSGEGRLYFEEIVTINDIFLLVAIRDKEILNNLKAVFNLIQDIGLGGNRSIGYGKVLFGNFEPFTKVEKYLNNKSNKFLTLAPLIPEENTYNLSNSYWEYFTFQGAIDNNYDFKNIDIWKDKVIYIKEGSVLTVKNLKSFYGSFYPAKDINGIKIYQYGLAFPLYFQGDQR